MAYDKTPQSRNEEILLSMINKTEYDKTPQSREEELLLELKDVIEQGGGGSSLHNYSTESQIVGTWIDGTTPVYEQTFYAPVTIGVGSWGNTGITMNSGEHIIQVIAFHENTLSYGFGIVSGFIQDGKLWIKNLGANANLTHFIVTWY